MRNLVSTAALFMVLSMLPTCAASAQSQKVEGIYLSSLTFFNKYGSTIDYEFYILYSNGQAYNGVPPGKVEELDFAAEKAKNPQSVGTWEEKGGAVRIAWGGGRETSTFQRRDDKSLDLKRGTSSRLVPLPDGQKIDGKYSRMSVAKGNGAFVSGSQSITFRPDGSYAGKMVVAASISPRSAESGQREEAGGSVKEREEAGTYSIKGYTITFTGKDGASSHQLFATLKIEPPATPEILYIGGGYMLRQ